MKRYTVLWTIGACLAIFQSAAAHHSGSMYDPSKILTLKGTVQEFRWVNPHVIIVLAAGESEPVAWTVEMSSPGNMRRLGWSGSALHTGQPVETTLAAMRDGSHGGSCRTVKTLDTAKSLNCSGISAIEAGEAPKPAAR
jgi:hypothetical protein